MSYKLVIKGQSENAEFPAVDSAEIPRLALYDGTYIPLVEDDGSDGTTLKVRIDDKVYRIKKGNQWEVYFAVEFSASGQSRAFVAVVDDSYKLKVFDATSGRAVFESTYLKRTSDSARNIYSVLDEYVHGPFYAEYGNSLIPVAERRPDTNLGDAGNRYTQICVATALSVQTLPFAEVALAWIIAAQGSAQGCIYNPNTRQNYYWGSYQQYGCVADHLYLFFNASSPYYTSLKNATLFTGKIRLIKLNQDGTSSVVDINPRMPVDEVLDTNFMAFAIPEKNVDVPFETFISDQRNNVQFMLDLYGGIHHTTLVAANTGHVEGKYLDITTVFYSPFTNSVTVKKSATVIAMNYTGPNYTPYVVKANYSAGDTFTFDGYTSYTSNYPVAMLAFANASNLPTEIVFLNSVRDVFGYIYNTQSEVCSRQTGTYLRLNGYNVELYTPFDGDLLVQPLMGAVSIVDGRSSWSFTQFCGFLMVFLASNSTIIVNTTAGDDVMIFDKDGTLLDDQIADSDGVVTFTVPTTKLGRSYRVQSATTGQSTDITATGNESVNLTPSAQLPDFEVMWAYQYGNNAGMISGNPDTGLAYNYKPYSEFKGKMLKQLCSTTYRAPFSVIGTPDGNQYHIYRENVTVTNGEGLRVCYGYQLSVDGVGVGTTGLLFDGDVRTLITVTYQSIRDYAPFTNTATLMYDSTNNITYCDVGNAVGPIVQNPPFVKVWEGTANIWSYALSAARTYFNSKPSYAVTTQLEEDVRCGDVGILPSYSSYAQNYLISQTFPARAGAYDRLILARKDVIYPKCEMAFMWCGEGSTMEACIIKQNNEHKAHNTTITGDFITIANSQSITIAAFAGKIKYKLNNNQMITMDASSGLSLTMSTDLQGISAFFCYPDMPYRYVIYQGISAGNVTDNRYTFKGAPKSAVTIAYTNGSNWEYGVAYDGSISATVTYDMDYKNTNNVWVNTRSNVSANHQSSNTYKIIGKTGAFTSTYSQNDAQFTGTSFEDVAQKVRQYFDSH